MIAVFSVIRFDVTLQRFLFCVLAELVISKMLFCSECFFTQWARNIFFNVDIPVVLSECFLGLELFSTHITNKITNHNCEFWFLQLLWSCSGECLSYTDSKAVLKLSLLWWPEQPIKCQASYRNSVLLLFLKLLLSFYYLVLICFLFVFLFRIFSVVLTPADLWYHYWFLR